MHILIAEDQQDTAGLLSAYFGGKGHQVAVARDGEETLAQVRALQPDLLLLDVIMPKLDGWAVLKTLRNESPQLPVIMLTAMSESEDAVRGLSLGADDYLRKPFDLAELEARVANVMRRSGDAAKPSNGEVMMLGALQIDDRRKEVRWQGSTITPAPKEYGLLFLLASEPGRVFSNNEIIAAIWGEQSNASAADVKQYIHLLRTRLGRIGVPKQVIETAKGFGYRLQIQDEPA